MPTLVRLSVDDVLTIRRQIAAMPLAARDAFGHVEPIQLAKLEMAVARQSTSLGTTYKYDSVHDVAASLLFGIAMDHAFENGNKRTALISTLVLLDRNKYLLVEASEDELYELARQLAAHELPLPESTENLADREVNYLGRWLKDRIRSRQLGDRPIMFRDLRALLESLGCEFGVHEKNYIKISHGRWTCRTGFPKQNFQVDVPEVKRIRRALRLDEAHGLDSAGFYDLQGQVSRFVNQHRNLLRRLADL